MVSTAPGLFKGSILIMALKPDGSANRMPVAKAYLKHSLSRAERDKIHDYIVNGLNELGAEGSFDLNAAIEGTLSVEKARGAILDYIRRAWQDSTASGGLTRTPADDGALRAGGRAATGGGELVRECPYILRNGILGLRWTGWSFVNAVLRPGLPR
jgi:hypothetical protein